MNLEELEEHYETISIQELTLGDLKEGDIFLFDAEPTLASHIVVKEKHYDKTHNVFYVDIKRTSITNQGYDGRMGPHHKVRIIKK